MWKGSICYNVTNESMSDNKNIKNVTNIFNMIFITIFFYGTHWYYNNNFQILANKIFHKENYNYFCFLKIKFVFPFSKGTQGAPEQ